MNRLRLCVVCVALFCCLNAAEAQRGYKWEGFAVATMGFHTSLGAAFTGAHAQLGASRGKTGFGLMASYESGETNYYGIEIEYGILNAYLSGVYKISDSVTVILSQGVSGGFAAADEIDRIVEGSDYVTAISLLYDTPIRLRLFGQARLQGRGLMLSVGFGF